MFAPFFRKFVFHKLRAARIERRPAQHTASGRVGVVILLADFGAGEKNRSFGGAV
jgi:hypothetical protein